MGDQLLDFALRSSMVSDLKETGIELDNFVEIKPVPILDGELGAWGFTVHLDDEKGTIRVGPLENE